MKKDSWLTGSNVVKLSWLAILLVILCFTAVYMYIAPPPPREITIATATVNGGYHRFGMQLKAALEKKGLKVNLRPSAGSFDNLKLLSDPDSRVSVAFCQSGAERYIEGGTYNIRALGSLYYEPLWIFYRKDSHLTSFSDMKKMKVAIGLAGSGTQLISKVLLKEHKIPESCWVPIGSSEAVKALLENRVQALFLVGPANDPMNKQKPHPLLSQLISNPAIDLLADKQIEAYISRMPELSAVRIGEGLLDIEKNFPAAPLTLISPMATLLCRSDLNSAIAVLILQTCREIQSEGSWLEKGGQFPSKQGVTLPLLPEAKQYLEKGPSFYHRIIPFRVAIWIDRLLIMIIPLIAVIFPLAKMAMPSFLWFIRRKIGLKYRGIMAIKARIASGAIENTIDADIAQLHDYEEKLDRMIQPLGLSYDFYRLKAEIKKLRDNLENIKAGMDKGNIKTSSKLEA